MGKRLIVIDGNSLINRAYYAMRRPMITKDGIYTQGIYGFLNMLNKIQDDYSPEYLAVAWDRKAPTFRHIEYSEYKAGRKKMPAELAMELPLIKEILTAMHIQNLELDGYEADDIIGTVARIAEEEGLEPLIITGDKDSLQLVTEHSHVLYTKKGVTEFDIYDLEKMNERYGLTPEQFIDLKGLMGDQSDNIPGIPGVGEKTGIKLLNQFGTLANMLTHTDEIANAKLKEKVEDNIQLAMMSRKLATINKFVPMDINLEEFRVTEPDYDTLINLYVELEFNTFLKKLHPNKEVDLEPAFDESKIAEEKVLIKSVEDMTKLDSIEEGSNIVLKVFNNYDHIDRPSLIGSALLTGKTYFYISFEQEETIAAFINCLNKSGFKITGHNLIRDYYALLFNDAKKLETEFDTEIAQYVLEPSKSSYSLKSLAFEKLHYEMMEETEVMEANSQMSLLGDSSESYMDFGLIWCGIVKTISEMQKKELKKENLEKVFTDVELPLIEVLASMEKEGFNVNKSTLDEFGKNLSTSIQELENKIHELAGTEFNINSPIQLGDILFEKLELPAGKKTKRGYSTSADILEKIKDKHPIVPLILQYRTLTKLNSTYVEGMKPLIGFDGRIRAHFQQTVTTTGRLSCTEPNLQNIPIRQELGRQLRKAFTAGEGYTLVGADYSQIELRIMAHLSGDENLIDAFNRGDDIHRNTAARVFNLDYDEVTPLDRSRAKAVNFGVIYGMSGFGLSEELKITRKQADNYIKDYFDKHKAVKDYLDSQVAYCKENGYTETITGRKRYIHEINASNSMTRQFGERLAKNSPIQGSAADIIKLAMIRVHNELKEKNYKSRLILQIHDELIIRTAKDEKEAVEELLIRNMEDAVKLSVKLESDLNSGDTWYDLK